MPRRKARTLTEVELEFMQIIWEAGEVNTEDVLAKLAGRGRKLSDGSVRKIFSILLAKGYLTRRPEGRGFLYAAAVAKDKANTSLLSDLVDRAFRGSAALMIAALLEGRSVSKKEMQQIKQLISNKEKGQ